MNVTIIGAGFVGVTTAVTLAEGGHQVQLVEIDEARRARLAQGELPFHEPGLEEALTPLIQEASITLHGHIDEVEASEAVLLCVGTPQGEDGHADLGQIEQATRELASTIPAWDTFPVVATKSTVPPGTARSVVLPILEQTAESAGAESARAAGEPGAGTGRDFGVASNPEFLREGNALEDARNPDRIVIGALDPVSAEVLERLYEQMDPPPDCPIVTTSLETAETIKYAANALLATKIAFANELANLCEPLGVNVDDVVEAVGMDHRINPNFLNAGCGFGGSCFPKDLAALEAIGRDHDIEMGILRAALANNERQPIRLVEMAERALGGSLTGKRIALLGLAFKPGTSDVRESRAIPIYRALTERGADVVCCDPVATEEFEAAIGESMTITADPITALTDADACILQTAWPEFTKLAPDDFIAAMSNPVVIDGRRMLDASEFAGTAVTYRALGDGEAIDEAPTTRGPAAPKEIER